ncbi:MAG TPA: glycosyltransferase family 2 protein [Candidatus Omnitrophota bacterium]|nr:glycosyltransferase family 2 protein [Candidatus Omnitrophota bacterium]HRY85833.1 glycosyltransferase family 2 protein [Candidatus Omnitrophota bacterium]
MTAEKTVVAQPKQSQLWLRLQEQLKITEAFLIFIFFPMLVYILMWTFGIPFRFVYYLCVTIYGFTAVVTIIEAFLAVRRKYALRRAMQETPIHPTYTIIISAFLPNEQNIILGVVRHFLERMGEYEGQIIQVILCYDTPHDLPVEEELRQFAVTHPKFMPYRAGGGGKAASLNKAIKFARGAITVLFDADHLPEKEVLGKVWRWLYSGYDVVQGRNIIRNYDENFLTSMIAVEFETVYAICHTAKSLLCDTAVFGGSNGYFLTSSLKKYSFDPDQMTEDIELSLRIQLDGGKILHDRSVLTSELAPTTWKHLWLQRKRWANGWVQVTLAHQWRVWQCKHLTLQQKLYWTYLLLWAQIIYPIGGFQVYALILAWWAVTGRFDIGFDWYIIATLILTMISGPIQIYCAYARQAKKLPVSYFIKYAFFNVFYAFFKMLVGLVGMRDCIAKERRWVVTSR